MANRFSLKYVREKYDEIATSIGLPAYHYVTLARLVEKYSFMKNPVIVDIGCGTGLLKFASIGNALICRTDISLEMLKIARSKNKFDEFILADARCLPFRQESLDIVVLSEVIEHLITPSVALKEVKRVLKKRGFLVLSFPNVLPYYPFYAILKKMSKNVKKRILEMVIKKDMLLLYHTISVSYYFFLLFYQLYIIPVLSCGNG